MIDQSELGFNHLDITLSGIKIYDGGMHDHGSNHIEVRWHLFDARTK